MCPPILGAIFLLPYMLYSHVSSELEKGRTLLPVPYEKLFSHSFWVFGTDLAYCPSPSKWVRGIVSLLDSGMVAAITCFSVRSNESIWTNEHILQKVYAMRKWLISHLSDTINTFEKLKKPHSTTINNIFRKVKWIIVSIFLRYNHAQIDEENIFQTRRHLTLYPISLK